MISLQPRKNSGFEPHLHRPLTELSIGEEVSESTSDCAIDIAEEFSRDRTHLCRIAMADISKRILLSFPLDVSIPPGRYTARAFLERQNEVLNQLSDRTVIDAAGKILDSVEPNLDRFSLVDEATCEDLSLYAGATVEQSLHNVADFIAKTQTVVGKVFFKGRLARPTDELEVLVNRRTLTENLMRDADLLEFLTSSLQILKDNEMHMLSFWNYRGQVLPGQADKYYCRLSETIDQWINENRRVLTVHATLEMIKTALNTALLFGAAVIGPLYIFSKAGLINDQEIKQYLEEYIRRVLGSSGPYYLLASFGPALAKTAATAIGSAMAMMMAKPTVEWNRVELEFNQMLHQKILAVAHYYRAVREVYNRLETLPMVAQLEHFHQLRGFIHNPQLQPLFRALDSRTFDGGPSYVYQLGNVLYPWRMLEKESVQQAFAGAIAAMAEIDVVLATVKLVQTTDAQGRSLYCIAQFLNGSAECPQIELEGVYHPMIAAQEAVANDVFLGGEGRVRNMVVTGVNASGKSTQLRSTLTAIIMAQSLAIAPARRMRLTLFGRVISAMRVVGQLESGDSLFQAQIKRVNSVIAHVKTHSHFTLVALDELFTGANSVEGPAVAYGAAVVLGRTQHAITMCATHFPNLLELEREEPGLWRNYCLKREQGRGDFRLRVGTCRLQDGIGIARHLGFDAEALHIAETMRGRLL